jgi:hypothetical protein
VAACSLGPLFSFCRFVSAPEDLIVASWGPLDAPLWTASFLDLAPSSLDWPPSLFGRPSSHLTILHVCYQGIHLLLMHVGLGDESALKDLGLLITGFFHFLLIGFNFCLAVFISSWLASILSGMVSSLTAISSRSVFFQPSLLPAFPLFVAV